jgi:hypothetical protein
MRLSNGGPHKSTPITNHQSHIYISEGKKNINIWADIRKTLLFIDATTSESGYMKMSIFIFNFFLFFFKSTGETVIYVFTTTAIKNQDNISLIWKKICQFVDEK